jgi:hypothetical protein
MRIEVHIPRQALVRPVLAIVVVLVLSAASTRSQGLPTLYIMPADDQFEVYVTAAIAKKKVPVAVRDTQDGADYTLKIAKVEITKESTGSKVVRCLFAYCAGIEDKGSTSVTLVRDGSIVWSYSVNKGRGSKNRQSMAEAIAKHMKDDYFKERRR